MTGILKSHRLHEMKGRQLQNALLRGSNVVNSKHN